MKTTTRLVARSLGFIVLAAGVAASIEAAPRQGGAGPRVSAPSHRGTPAAPRATAPRATAPRTAAPRAAAPRGHPPARGTANGVARYGYGYDYGYGYGSPWWGAGWYGGYWGAGWYGDYWGVGWYGGWGWPGYGYTAYGPWYAPYYDYIYVAPAEAEPLHGPAIVETGVSPSKAEVVLDGDMVGFASDYNGRWDRLTVAPGPHTIAFQKKGYRTLVVAFEARPGATYALNDALVPGEGEDRRTLPPAASSAPPETREPLPAGVGRLRVHAQPGDAAVYLDGEYLGLGAELGRIHAALAVATGTHRLEAVRPGYVSAVRAIEVGETDLATVELILEPER